MSDPVAEARSRRAAQHPGPLVAFAADRTPAAYLGRAGRGLPDGLAGRPLVPPRRRTDRSLRSSSPSPSPSWIQLLALWLGLDPTRVTWWAPVLVELVPIVVAYGVVTVLLEARRPAVEYAPARWAGLPAGLVAGALVCLVVTGIVWAMGGIVFTGTSPNPPWLSQLVSLGVVAGIAEEVALRGILFRFVESLLGTWAAVAVSALIFGGLHLANPHATMTGAIAIALEAGLMFAVLYALTRSLWVVVGVHAGWNLMQGLGLGIVVSGSSDEGLGFLVSHPAGPDAISGGQFGIEASAVAVAVWLLVAAYLSWRLVRSGGVVQPLWRRHKRFPGNPPPTRPSGNFSVGP